MLPDALQDHEAPFVEFPELAQPFPNLGDLFFIEAARHLLAVTRYEGDGGTPVKKLDCPGYLPFLYAGLGGYDPEMFQNDLVLGPRKYDYARSQINYPLSFGKGVIGRSSITVKYYRISMMVPLS